MAKKVEHAAKMDLMTYLKKGTNPFSVVEASAEWLEEDGFEKLSFGETWKLKAGKRYYTIPYKTTLFAFAIGEDFRPGKPIHMACAHTDHPCLRIKPAAEMTDHGYQKLDIEVYGGPILNTWLDRPLSIGGRIMLKSEDVYHPIERMLDIGEPICIIPNLAIHMNREVNKGVELNKQTEMLPLFGLAGETADAAFFRNYLADRLDCAETDILDFDLYLYNAELPDRLGANKEMLSSPRLDNLTSCYAAVNGITRGASKDRLQVIVLFDNEEIGSRTKQGADSLLANFLLQKVYRGLGADPDLLADSLADSMVLSLDVAHAYHPNYGSKSDPNLKCIMGQGPAIKINYNQKYATDTEAIAILQQLCLVEGIPFQKYVNRSDQPGGGTLGTITSGYLPMKTVDLGIPILAMHSSRELMGYEDQEHLNRLVEAFFSEKA